MHILIETYYQTSFFTLFYLRGQRKMLTQISDPVSQIQGSRLRLFNGDIVTNSGELKRNGTNHRQIIKFVPLRSTLLVYLDPLGGKERHSKVKALISWMKSHLLGGFTCLTTILLVYLT